MVEKARVINLNKASRLLLVDLSTRKVYPELIAPEIINKFYGGLGLNTWLLYNHTGPETDPLGPDNIVLISPGLLTGTDAPASPRVEVTTKSPLTGLIGTGNVGGHWGPKLRKAGISTLMIRGVSPQPVTLIINEDDVGFDSAEGLWGKDTFETTDELVRELGSDYSVMAIGLAGENLVKFAAPIFDKQHIPGRCHAGAVLGSKKLKAIAVKGNAYLRPYDTQAYEGAVASCEARIRSYPGWKARSRAGSMGAIGVTEAGVDYEEFVVPHVKRGKPGVYCPCMMESLYGCSLQTDIKEGPYAGTEVTCAGLSLYSGTASRYKVSLPAAYHFREMCQRYGMDMFGPFSYAFSLYEKGIISESETGHKLVLGDDEALMKLPGMVAHRKGIGNHLAEGSVATAKALGGDAKKHVVTVKGLELMNSDPQTSLKGNVFTSLSILTNPRGGDDLKGTHAVSNYPGLASWAKKLGVTYDAHSRWLLEWLDMPEEFKRRVFGYPPNISQPDQVLMTIWYNNLSSVYNSLGLCMFASSAAEALGPTCMAMLYSAATGIKTTPRDIMRTGERVFNLMRLYVTREGVKRDDDHWPSSLYEETFDGRSHFSAIETESNLERYYKLRGWSLKTGRPLTRTLKRLDLET
jgi:aldehyde:ferredoxin oxidoreductase